MSGSSICGVQAIRQQHRPAPQSWGARELAKTSWQSAPPAPVRGHQRSPTYAYAHPHAQPPSPAAQRTAVEDGAGAGVDIAAGHHRLDLWIPFNRVVRGPAAQRGWEGGLESARCTPFS